MGVVEFILKNFDHVSLAEMDKVKLMNRVDTKYVCALDNLPLILFDLHNYYKVLQINEERIMSYKTLYFDTPDFKMFLDHQNGKLNRYKIRQREYVNTGLNFLEIKFKNNKGRTIKTRINTDNDQILDTTKSKFIEKSSPFFANKLQPKLWNSFKRITLVSNNERITIDLALCFNDGKENDAEYLDLAVIEVKQAQHNSNSLIKTVLKEHKIFPDSFSKYCIGTASLYNHLKINRFKSKILLINKLIA